MGTGATQRPPKAAHGKKQRRPHAFRMFQHRNDKETGGDSEEEAREATGYRLSGVVIVLFKR